MSHDQDESASTRVPIGEPAVDDEREEKPSLRSPVRRLSTRTLAMITIALWLVAAIVVAIVIMIWQTPPLQPLDVG